MRNNLLATLTVVGFSLTMPAAFAATISNGFVVPVAQTPWGVTQTLNQFNPSLGTLTGVTLRWEASSYAEVDIFHGTGSGSVSFDKLGSQTQFTVPGAIIIGAPAPAQAILWSNNDPNPLLVTTQLFTVPGLLVVGQANWGLYTGTGTVDVDVDTNPLVEGFSATGDFRTAELRTFGGGNMIVDYSYEPVPEPGTYALMAFGLTGLAVVRARRRRQA